MCGRYGRRSDKQKIEEQFRATPTPAELPNVSSDRRICTYMQHRRLRQRFLNPGTTRVEPPLHKLCRE